MHITCGINHWGTRRARQKKKNTYSYWADWTDRPQLDTQIRFYDWSYVSKKRGHTLRGKKVSSSSSSFWFFPLIFSIWNGANVTGDHHRDGRGAHIFYLTADIKTVAYRFNSIGIKFNDDGWSSKRSSDPNSLSVGQSTILPRCNLHPADLVRDLSAINNLHLQTR